MKTKLSESQAEAAEAEEYTSYNASFQDPRVQSFTNKDMARLDETLAEVVNKTFPDSL